MSRELQLDMNRTHLLAIVAALAATGCDSKSPPGTSNSSEIRALPRERASVSSMVDFASSKPAPSTADQGFISVPPADAAYALLLRELLTENGLVRYEVLDKPEQLAALQSVVRGYAKWRSPPEDKFNLAVWLNAYNANVLGMIAEARQQAGFTSVKDISGFFDQKTVIVESRTFTLRTLMEQIDQLGDPRVHAAMVNGTRSSPPLRAEPYEGHRLDQQLSDQCRRWLDDQGSVRFSRDALQLNAVFGLHAEEFNVDPYGGVVGFVRKFARPNGMIRDFIRNVPNLKVTYDPYDWRLNIAPVEPPVENRPSHE
jgi:hypothetical protein